MEKELSGLRDRVKSLTETIVANAEKLKGAKDFAGLVKKYVDIQALDSELVHTLIEKIYVHQKEIVDGKAQVRVDIYYRFIGNASDDKNTITFRNKKN